MTIELDKLPMSESDRALLKKVLVDGDVIDCSCIPDDQAEALGMAVRRLCAVANIRLRLDVFGDGDDQRIVSVAVPKPPDKP